MLRYILFLFSLYSFQSFSQTGSVFGKVTNSQDEGLPYANIVIQGTASGTTSNLDGFYELTLPEGKYKLSFQYIGYATKSVELVIELGKKINIDIVLEDEKLELDEVVVRANEEDPAYEIIRQAQNKRKFHLKENKNYSVYVYTKLYGQSNSKKPGNISFFGTDLIYQKGVFYFSETIYKHMIDNSGKMIEELQSSIIHKGVKDNISENNPLFINLYQRSSFSLVMGKNVTKVKSPISEDAFLYYKFKWEGSYIEEDRMINKIYIEPKSPMADLYTGYIYIIENEWRVLKANLAIKGVLALSLGNPTITTQYGYLKELDKWVPLLTKFVVEKTDSVDTRENIQIYHVNIWKDFDFSKVDIPKSNINRLANREAINNDTTYWKVERPISLTDEESRSIINSFKNSNEFDGFVTDSSLNLNKKEESKLMKFGAATRMVLGSYKFDISDNYSLQKNGFLDFLSFNTVEGWVINSKLTLAGRAKNPNAISFSQSFRYGFASNRFYHNSTFRYELNPRKLSAISIQGGDYVDQISGEELGTVFYNSIYSLFRRENFLKIYNKRYIASNYSQELFNGLDLTLGASYSQRNPLQNNSNFAWTDESKRSYTPNIAVVNDEPIDFVSNKALALKFKLEINFARTYDLINGRKIVLPNKYPVLTFALDQGIGDVNYLKSFANVKYNYQVGLLGKSKISATHGRFLDQNQITVLDYFHFNANQFIFINDEQNLGLRYQLMSFYNFSTPSTFTGFNFSHFFEGALFKRLPLLKHSGIRSIIHFNYLNTIAQGNYFEIGAGFEHRVLPVRFDYYWSYLGDEFLSNGLRLNYYLGKK